MSDTRVTAVTLSVAQSGSENWLVTVTFDGDLIHVEPEPPEQQQIFGGQVEYVRDHPQSQGIIQRPEPVKLESSMDIRLGDEQTRLVWFDGRMFEHHQLIKQEGGEQGTLSFCWEIASREVDPNSMGNCYLTTVLPAPQRDCFTRCLWLKPRSTQLELRNTKAHELTQGQLDEAWGRLKRNKVLTRTELFYLRMRKAGTLYLELGNHLR